MISVRCAHCDRTFTFTANAAGRQVRCKCGAQMRVPESFFDALRDEPWSSTSESGAGGVAVMDPPATKARTSNFSRSAELRGLNVPSTRPAPAADRTQHKPAARNTEAPAPSQAKRPDATPVVPRAKRDAGPDAQAVNEARRVAARHKAQLARQRQARITVACVAGAAILAGIGWIAVSIAG